MKLTRKQLKRLIEASIKTTKRAGRDYVIPAEEPLVDPLDDTDYSDEQKPKLRMVALSDDEETQTQANVLADIGGYKGTDRYGIDNFSQNVKAYEIDIDMLNDPEIDLAITRACDQWIYKHHDMLTNFDAIDQGSFDDYAEYMIEDDEEERLDSVEDIKILTRRVLDSMIKDVKNPNLPVDPKLPPAEQRIAKYERAKKIFVTTHEIEAVADHLILKLQTQLYPVYNDYKQFYEREQGYDLSNPEHRELFKKTISTFKEGKMKITKRQLIKLINENLLSESGILMAAAGIGAYAVAGWLFGKNYKMSVALRPENDRYAETAHMLKHQLGNYEKMFDDLYRHKIACNDPDGMAEIQALVDTGEILYELIGEAWDASDTVGAVVDGATQVGGQQAAASGGVVLSKDAVKSVVSTGSNLGKQLLGATVSLLFAGYDVVSAEAVAQEIKDRGIDLEKLGNDIEGFMRQYEQLKSGDLSCRLPDGTITYPKDQGQIKALDQKIDRQNSGNNFQSSYINKADFL